MYTRYNDIKDEFDEYASNTLKETYLRVTEELKKQESFSVRDFKASLDEVHRYLQGGTGYKDDPVANVVVKTLKHDRRPVQERVLAELQELALCLKAELD